MNVNYETMFKSEYFVDKYSLKLELSRKKKFNLSFGKM
jgi:hypothetical protein